ncbi:MAG: hypothetical protein WBC22_10520, partial [Sedimentisphaerales bacterium]
MQRKEAEKLLAALIFDDLDEASKTELLTYLQTDNELRERLADMRMAVKVASDTVQHGPDPVLGRRRLKRLARLARGHHTWTTMFTAPRLAAAAAIFIIASVGLALLLNTFSAMDASKEVTWAKTLTQANERTVAYEESIYGFPTDAPSRGKQATETASTRGQFVLHSGARRPEVVDKGYAYEPGPRGPGAADSGTVINGVIQNDRRNLIIDDFEVTAGAQTSPLHGYDYSPPKTGQIDKWTSASSF